MADWAWVDEDVADVCYCDMNCMVVELVAIVVADDPVADAWLDGASSIMAA